jgi:hypothetical protein
MFNNKELELLSHCLGININHAIKSRFKKDKKLPKTFYRNYFCLQDVESFNNENFRQPYYDLFTGLKNNKYVDSFDKFGNKCVFSEIIFSNFEFL